MIAHCNNIIVPSCVIVDVRVLLDNDHLLKEGSARFANLYISSVHFMCGKSVHVHVHACIPNTLPMVERRLCLMTFFVEYEALYL